MIRAETPAPFHGGNTSSNLVGDAIKSSTYKMLRERNSLRIATLCYENSTVSQPSEADAERLILEVIRGEMRIALGRLEARVSHQNLHRSQWDARHDEMGCVGVP